MVKQTVRSRNGRLSTKPGQVHPKAFVVDPEVEEEPCPARVEEDLRPAYRVRPIQDPQFHILSFQALPLNSSAISFWRPMPPVASTRSLEA